VPDAVKQGEEGDEDGERGGPGQAAGGADGLLAVVGLADRLEGQLPGDDEGADGEQGGAVDDPAVEEAEGGGIEDERGDVAVGFAAGAAEGSGEESVVFRSGGAAVGIEDAGGRNGLPHGGGEKCGGEDGDGSGERRVFAGEKDEGRAPDPGDGAGEGKQTEGDGRIAVEGGGCAAPVKPDARGAGQGSNDDEEEGAQEKRGESGGVGVWQVEKQEGQDERVEQAGRDQEGREAHQAGLARGRWMGGEADLCGRRHALGRGSPLGAVANSFLR